jgi:hypothetical protein
MARTKAVPGSKTLEYKERELTTDEVTLIKKSLATGGRTPLPEIPGLRIDFSRPGDDKFYIAAKDEYEAAEAANAPHAEAVTARAQRPAFQRTSETATTDTPVGVTPT